MGEFARKHNFEQEEYVGWSDRCGITGEVKNAAGNRTTVTRVQLPGEVWESISYPWSEAEEEVVAWEEYGHWKRMLLEEIRDAMDTELTPTQSRYIQLYFFCGLNWREIADLYGSRFYDGYIKTAHKGVDRLRELFGSRREEYLDIHP